MSRFPITRDENPEKRRGVDSVEERQLKQEALFERLWKENPKEMKDHFTKERLDFVKELAKKHPRILAIGSTEMATQLFLEGYDVTAIDIANNALKNVPEGMKRKRAALPNSKLDEGAYDLILCFDLIAAIHPEDWRLALSELQRLLSREGRVILSTPLDVRSSDALLRLHSLVNTEFKIEKERFEYKAPLIRITKMASYPMLCYRAQKSPLLRNLELSKREGVSRKLFAFFSGKIAYLLLPIAFLLKPLTYLQHVNMLEKLVKLLSQEEGISYVEYVLYRRSMIEEDEPPLPERAPFIKSVEWQ